MERESGYYFVKPVGWNELWQIAKWDAQGECWFFCGNDIPHFDHDFLQVSPAPILLPK